MEESRDFVQIVVVSAIMRIITINRTRENNNDTKKYHN
jgi:hypothetical protein